VIQLAWSPDGRTLAALTPDAALLLEPPHAWLALPKTSSNAQSVRTLAPRRRLPVDLLAHGLLAHGFAWTPDGQGLTVFLEQAGVSLDGERLVHLPLSGKPATPLVHIPENSSSSSSSRLGAFIWVPDGSGVLFAYGDPENTPTWLAEHWQTTSGFVARPARPLGICSWPQPPPGLFLYAAQGVA
jgi:hypothetical protein